MQRECGCEGDDDLGWALGPPLRGIIERLLGSSDEVAVRRAIGIYRTHHPTVCLTHARVYEGIPQALDALRASGLRLFVATSKLALVARNVLDHFRLANRFDGIHGTEADGRPSDKSEVVAHVLQRYHLVPAATVMVGDRSYDIQAAHAAGMHSVAVTYGYGSEHELRASRPDATCRTPAELQHLGGLLPPYNWFRDP